VTGDAPAPERIFRNPVLPGCHPDPSICRVGADYYLVTSTFEWFPGLPVEHSRDLVHWRRIGHVLDRPSQLPLDGVRASGGLYAPTLRYHDGTFYVVCTLVDGTDWSGHFVVTASDPSGPWSEPHLLDGDGFDPSLFFDEDGRAWFTATRLTGRYEGHTETWLREFDPSGPRLTGPEHVIWDGAVKDAIYSEAPHLYKIGGRYHLLTAEGGTAGDHSVMHARADHITGPYRSHPRNPVLTHRHRGPHQPITAVGHGDLVDTPGGEWWMVLLAIRPFQGGHGVLGRETFLTPVTWTDGWPNAGPLEPVQPAPGLPEHRWPAEPACDHFDAPDLAPYWTMLRTPRERWWSLAARPGHLRLRLRPESLSDVANPSFIGRRQQHAHFAASTRLEFSPRDDNECAGIALVQNDRFHILLVVMGRRVRLIRREDGTDTVLAEHPVEDDRFWLAVEGHDLSYQARYATDPGRWRPLGDPFDGRILSSQIAGGFTGALLGMYASSNATPSDNHADFTWFEYTAI
jgi:xylan 1,4-beta-xylosidase